MHVRVLQVPSDYSHQWTFTREDLHPSRLNEMSSYQRPLQFLRVRIMARDWQPGLCMPLSVNERFDGTMAVIDGQHRVAAAIQAQVPTLECRVYHGLTLPQEAELFRLLNSATRQISPGELFRAAILAGEDTSVAVQNICRDYGFEVDYFKTRGPRVFKCISTVLGVYRDLGTWRQPAGAAHPERLHDVLGVLGRIWHEENRRTDGDIVAGLDAFLTTHPEADRDRLAHKLGEYSAILVLNRGRSLSGGAGSRRLIVGTVLWKIYNNGLRKHDQLAMRFPARYAMEDI